MILCSCGVQDACFVFDRWTGAVMKRVTLGFNESELYEWGQRPCQLQQGMQKISRREHPHLHRCQQCTLTNQVRSSEHLSTDSEDMGLHYHPTSRWLEGPQLQPVWTSPARSSVPVLRRSEGMEEHCHRTGIWLVARHSPWKLLHQPLCHRHLISHPAWDKWRGQPAGGVPCVRLGGASSEAPCGITSLAMVLHTRTGMLEVPGGYRKQCSLLDSYAGCHRGEKVPAVAAMHGAASGRDKEDPGPP